MTARPPARRDVAPLLARGRPGPRLRAGLGDRLRAGFGAGLGPGGRGRDDRERGSIMLMTIGFLAVGLMLLVVAVDVAAVQLARTQLWDAADGAALDASDAVARDALYRNGLGATVPVTDATVAQAASAYLGALDRPRLVSSWRVEGAATDGGQGASVRVVGHVDLPLLGPVVAAFSDGVTVTVESHARARTGP